VAEAPRRHVVRARRQFHRGVGAEGEPVTAGVKLGVKSVVRARPNASKTGRSAAASRREGEAVAVARARLEDEAVGAGAWRRRGDGNFPGGWRARVSSPFIVRT
jgi:hypothetical protein